MPPSALAANPEIDGDEHRLHLPRTFPQLLLLQARADTEPQQSPRPTVIELPPHIQTAVRNLCSLMDYMLADWVCSKAVPKLATDPPIPPMFLEYKIVREFGERQPKTLMIAMSTTKRERPIFCANGEQPTIRFEFDLSYGDDPLAKLPKIIGLRGFIASLEEGQTNYDPIATLHQYLVDSVSKATDDKVQAARDEAAKFGDHPLPPW